MKMKNSDPILNHKKMIMKKTKKSLMNKIHKKSTTFKAQTVTNHKLRNPFNRLFRKSIMTASNIWIDRGTRKQTKARKSVGRCLINIEKATMLLIKKDLKNDHILSNLTRYYFTNSKKFKTITFKGLFSFILLTCKKDRKSTKFYSIILLMR